MKKWVKPVINIIKDDQLKNYIAVSACSSNSGGVFRLGEIRI